MKRAASEIRERKHRWKHEVVRHGCVMCIHTDTTGIDPAFWPDLRVVQGHHIITQQQLKNRGLRESQVVWDERNGIGLCRYHHARHHHYNQRVPRELLPDAAFEFADDHDLSWLLGKEYPA